MNEQILEVDLYELPNEVDPTVPTHVKEITEEEIQNWNENLTKEITANDVKFEDGTTFQEKYDSGELKGEKGQPGEQGKPGKDGVDGKTPIKGQDYFTIADKQELVEMVLTEIPNGEGIGY